jgi:hypothetical protein
MTTLRAPTLDPWTRFDGTRAVQRSPLTPAQRRRASMLRGGWLGGATNKRKAIGAPVPESVTFDDYAAIAATTPAEVRECLRRGMTEVRFPAGLLADGVRIFER